jgi:glycosyltransferase involved in cell wall biosynthesis
VARILQVCNTDFYLTKFLAPLVRALASAGHEVECVCEGNRLEAASALVGAKVHAFDFPRTNSPAGFAAAIGKLRAVIRAGGYDCVDSHNRNASIVGRVAAWQESVPINLYTAHGFYFHDDQSPLAHFMTVRLEAALARITDFTLSQSTEDVGLMTGRGYVLPHRIEVIGNGIDTTRFVPRPEERAAIEASLSLPNGRFRVVTTGRLVKGKGFTDLLQAFARLHAKDANTELMIIGGNIEQDISPYQSAFLAEAAALGVKDALVVTGITDKVAQYLATADVFVLPSYREGMPRALLEGMSMALPAVATDIRGCREVVVDGQSGLLFDPHDVTRLAEILTELRGDPARRAELGRAARRRVVEGFDEAGYVARQVAVINRLAGEPARSRASA